MRALLLWTCLNLVFSAYGADGKQFGAAIPEGDGISLQQAVAKFEQLKNKEIIATGQVKGVCQAKGCWMEVHDGAAQMRVTFKDYGFFVDKDLDGSNVRMHGQLIKKETTVAEQKHYLQDANAPAEEIAAVTKPKVEFSFVAKGVIITP